MMRNHREIYDHLEHYPRRIIIPHRLNPYPTAVMYYASLFLSFFLCNASFYIEPTCVCLHARPIHFMHIPYFSLSLSSVILSFIDSFICFTDPDPRLLQTSECPPAHGLERHELLPTETKLSRQKRCKVIMI